MNLSSSIANFTFHFLWREIVVSQNHKASSRPGRKLTRGVEVTFCPCKLGL